LDETTIGLCGLKERERQMKTKRCWNDGESKRLCPSCLDDQIVDANGKWKHVYPPAAETLPVPCGQLPDFDEFKHRFNVCYEGNSPFVLNHHGLRSSLQERELREEEYSSCEDVWNELQNAVQEYNNGNMDSGEWAYTELLRFEIEWENVPKKWIDWTY
jgi:hypothetical protein